MTLRRRQWLSWAALAAAPGGCALMIPETRMPMDLLRPPRAGTERAQALVVMLPGAYSRPPEFVDEGFVSALRACGADADVVIADSHLGYFNDKSILRRLREDVILPARAEGYRTIWLVGISLGGFGALGYAVRHPAEVDGVLLLAPYLGPRRLMMDIAQAGGPKAWRATQPPRGPDDVDREVWDWLAGPPPALPLYLGYGREDRFADAHRVLAGLLPEDSVTTAPGGHDWPAWRELWQGWLARGLLPGGCRTVTR